MCNANDINSGIYPSAPKDKANIVGSDNRIYIFAITNSEWQHIRQPRIGTKDIRHEIINIIKKFAPLLLKDTTQEIKIFPSYFFSKETGIIPYKLDITLQYVLFFYKKYDFFCRVPINIAK